MAFEDAVRVEAALHEVLSAPEHAETLAQVGVKEFVALVTAVLSKLESGPSRDAAPGETSREAGPRDVHAGERSSSRTNGSVPETVVGSDVPLTTNRVAALLGMSRGMLIKLLDHGEIPFHYVGRDRRIWLRDVEAYHEQREAAARAFQREAATRRVSTQ